MDWRHIPSLSALRAFEAAARHGSYSAAARELNVTHSAIAQHLRGLEDYFARPLMRRVGQKMITTDDGQRLAISLGEAFGLISDAAEDLLTRDASRPLRISTTPSFAESWLMPRIGGFWSNHPEIELELVPSMKLVDLRKDGSDLAIRYGRGDWPGVKSEPLVTAAHVVVASPDLIGQRSIGCVADLQGEHWLMGIAREEEKVWVCANGLDLDKARVTTLDTSALVMQAVRAGHGVSIVPRAIAAADIDRGNLQVLCEEEDSAFAYHILTLPTRVSPKLAPFMRWLKAQV